MTPRAAALCSLRLQPAQHLPQARPAPVPAHPTVGAREASTGCVSDADLVARARQGDSAAFGELVDRHRTAVYRATRAALGSHADAEDAAQDAFVAAYERLASFRGEASFKTWLLTIAWHQAINRRRSHARWWRHIVEPARSDEGDRPVEFDIASSAPSPEQTAAGEQLQRAIAGEIQALPATLRDTLLLAQAGELTYDEIAAMTKTPLGTIKWRVSEARKVIRKKLKERGFADAE
jgi:RNA polymerase sigma-70 factor, ECF subfamily